MVRVTACSDLRLADAADYTELLILLYSSDI